MDLSPPRSSVRSWSAQASRAQTNNSSKAGLRSFSSFRSFPNLRVLPHGLGQFAYCIQYAEPERILRRSAIYCQYFDPVYRETFKKAAAVHGRDPRMWRNVRCTNSFCYTQPWRRGESVCPHGNTPAFMPRASATYGRAHSGRPEWRRPSSDSGSRAPITSAARS